MLKAHLFQGTAQIQFIQASDKLGHQFFLLHSHLSRSLPCQTEILADTTARPEITLACGSRSSSWLRQVSRPPLPESQRFLSASFWSGNCYSILYCRGVQEKFLVCDYGNASEPTSDLLDLYILIVSITINQSEAP